ncbi:MAG TPA: hypothetical protein P5060_00465 [Candidatus Absconditabacterales bacterium]|nr:hypothetical protein [Candidatus Absconditabacterales bacterium]
MTEIINPFCAGCKNGSKHICCINTAERLDFTRSYLNATKILAEALKKEDEEQLFHPLAFMIRHSIELLIKNELINKCGKDFKDVVGENHNLKNLLNELVCKTTLFNYIKEDEIFIFDNYDKDSFEFRYPVDKKNQATCGGLCCFGIDEVIKLCDNMLSFIDKECPDNNY